MRLSNPAHQQVTRAVGAALSNEVNQGVVDEM